MIRGFKYKAAGYARVSKKEEGENSKSINNQISLIEKFANENCEIFLAKIFVDDGKSGKDMDGKGMEELLKALKNKEFNCLIVKDFSRLGRNYIEVGKLIYDFIPELGTRLVSIEDNFDSFLEYEDRYLELGIKNIANEYYRKEVSKKVKLTFDNKKRKGEYLGGIPPYGYKREGNKTIVDLDIKPVVELICNMRCDGISCRNIADYLNDNNIDSPGKYLNKLYGKNIFRGKLVWDRYAIYRILNNNLIK